MKKILLLTLFISHLFAWETTTHRAIDKTAIESKSVVNLKNFVASAGIENEDYSQEIFEGYSNKKTGKSIKYFEYFYKEFSSDAMAEWGQTFSSNVPSYQNLIEAGTMLEDAQWPHWLDGGEYNYYDIGDGRFNNHFANPQNNYKKLWLGGKSALTKSALVWATDVESNKYDYKDALDYFVWGFSSSTPDNLSSSTPKQRKKYQAKMQKSQRLLVRREEVGMRSAKWQG